MKVTYLENEQGNILLSTTRHDYVSDGDAFIDGGQEGNLRYNESNGYVKKTEPLKEILPRLVNKLKWTSISDKHGNLLEKPVVTKIKDLETEHIVAILKTQKNIPILYKVLLQSVLKKRDPIYLEGDFKRFSLSLEYGYDIAFLPDYSDSYDTLEEVLDKIESTSADYAVVLDLLTNKLVDLELYGR